MTGAIWNHVRSAAEVLAAARQAKDAQTRANLRRAGHDLLRQGAIANANGPSWADVLVADSR